MVNLLLVNKGDSAVTVSDIWFEFAGGPGCCGRRIAIKVNEKQPAAPILVPSMQALKVSIRVTLNGLLPSEPGFLPAPRNFRMVGKDGGALPPTGSPPPPITVEQLSVTVSLTTVGPNFGRQDTKLPLVIMHFDNERYTGHSYLPSSYVLTLIRKDPPIFKSLWDSWVD